MYVRGYFQGSENGRVVTIGQKDKQPSTKQTHKAKNRVTGSPLKTGGELFLSYEFCLSFIQNICLVTVIHVYMTPLLCY